MMLLTYLKRMTTRRFVRGAMPLLGAALAGTLVVLLLGCPANPGSAFDDELLTNVHNVSDAGSLELEGAYSVTTATIGDSSYLFVGGFGDDGVSVFSIANDGRLTPVHSVTDDASLELDGAVSVTTATIGSSSYLFVAGYIDDGVSVFSIANDGRLTPVHSVTDAGSLELYGANSVTTATIGSSSYLFVAGYDDDGVSVFSIADTGRLTPVQNVPDDATLELDGAYSFTTATIGSSSYLFVAGYDDDGVSVFSIADTGRLTHVHNVSDDATLELDGAASVTTASIGSSSYLFVAGEIDDGVSVFRIENTGMLTPVQDVPDAGSLELDGANSVTTATIGGSSYLFVAGFADDGVSAFSIADTGRLTPVQNVPDNATLELSEASLITTATVGSTSYLFVAGFADDGVSVFSINE